MKIVTLLAPYAMGAAGVGAVFALVAAITPAPLWIAWAGAVAYLAGAWTVERLTK